MNMRSKRTFQATGLLALLPVGAFLTMLVVSTMTHRYDDGGFGFYHGLVQGRLNGQQSLFYLEFDGETKPQWYWASPENYVYQSLELKWRSWDSEDKGVLDLRSLVVTTETDTFTLSEANISEMLRPNANQEAAPTQAEVAAVYSLLTAAAEGDLPRPRHHPRSFEEPLAGGLTHFSLGWHFPYAVGGWCLVWLAIAAICLMRARKSRRASRAGTGEAKAPPAD